MNMFLLKFILCTVLFFFANFGTFIESDKQKMVTSNLFKFILLVGSIISSSVNADEAEKEVVQQEKSSKVQFHQWSKEHGKVYTCEEERLKRHSIWQTNNGYIEQHNRKKPRPSYELGHNQFSDLTVEEYHQRNFLHTFSPGIVAKRKKKSSNLRSGGMTKGRVRGENNPLDKTFVSLQSNADITRKLNTFNDIDDLPQSVDWVKEGAVTKVKYQGLCASSWAFSVVSAIEGARVVQGREKGLENVTLISLSEQQMLDCDTNDHSCHGGV